jgi:hypothetical protein
MPIEERNDMRIVSSRIVTREILVCGALDYPQRARLHRRGEQLARFLVSDHRREREALLDFLEKHLKAEFKDRNAMFGNFNDDRYKKYLHGLILKITQGLFKIINDRAHELNIYTYEFRYGSKASTVFQADADIPAENVLWKELLIFLMNTKEKGGYLNFLRGIEPLGFDPALVGDYLDCFQSDSAKSEVMDELEHLYDEEVEDKKTRLQMMGVIGAPGVDFSDDDEEVDDDDFGIDTSGNPDKDPWD